MSFFEVSIDVFGPLLSGKAKPLSKEGGLFICCLP